MVAWVYGRVKANLLPVSNSKYGLRRQINLHQQKAKSAFADWQLAHEGGLCLL
ncbi:MAG TPA: hypothetical protein PLD25_03415 [Chloroflexota bacterium]|nr:hypothetical protein [Chloroflexota bacterium]